MRRPNRPKVLWSMYITCLVGLLALAALAAPGQAQGGLPSRNTPTPTPSRGGQGGGTPVGAGIELHAMAAPAGAWAGVQWQDSAGDWHDVEGWQGAVEPSGCQSWWVAARDFGTGPFRWAVSQARGVAPLAYSASFTLPGTAGQLLVIEVEIGSR
jgi:hypothetical protein